MSNMGMRVAIIGARGYIGRHLDYFLQEHYGITPAIYDIIDYQGQGYKKINLSEKTSLKDINYDVDIVFNFAGLTGTYIGFDNYKGFVENNEIGLLNLLDAIRQSGKKPKIIFPSSRLVYKGQDKPLKEEDPKECKTIYAVNKLSCEGILNAYRQSFDIPYTIFRICVPYGNLLSSDYSFGTIGFFIRQAKEYKTIKLYGGGDVKRTFTHMEDLCTQLIDGAFSPFSNDNIYNIGGETLTLRAAAEIIAKKYGANIEDVPWPLKDLKIESGHTYFDDTKIKKLLHQRNYRKLEDFTKDL